MAAIGPFPDLLQSYRLRNLPSANRLQANIILPGPSRSWENHTHM